MDPVINRPKNTADLAHGTRQVIVTCGGAFMVSPHLAAEEQRLGLPERSLYFRGRSAVLGGPPADVVGSLFGIFPQWLIGLMLDQATPLASAEQVIEAYTRGCAAWGRDELPADDAAAEAAELLYRVADAADLSALPLAAGWRVQRRPKGNAERLAHALMLTREVRGGLHFAALRACDLTIPEAAAADPNGGRARLLRTGWTPDDADELISRAERRGDLHERWHRAERLTDEAFGTALAVLGDPERAKLVELLERHRAG